MSSLSYSDNYFSESSTMFIQIKGELQGEGALKFEGYLNKQIEKNCKKIIIDLSSLQYVDSASLSVLIRSSQKAIELGKEMKLYSPSPNIRKILEIVKLDEILPITDQL